MVRMTIDKALREKLGGLDDTLELYDESGRALGRFVPVHQSSLADVEAQCPHTAEELDARQARGGGRPLADIWKDLEQE